MSEFGSLQAPPWLQRNWEMKEPFDPSPWLQKGFENRMAKAKLPLELQHMELANKASELAIEHQGMMNDQVNQDLNLYQQEIPALDAYMKQSVDNPDITPPAVRSKQGIAAVLSRQRVINESAYGKAMAELQNEQTKQATDIAKYLGVEVPRDHNGRFNQEMIADLSQQAEETKHQRIVDDKEADREATAAWHKEVAGINAQARIATYGARTAAGKQTAAIANLEYRQDLKQQIADAEFAGDFDTADALQEDLTQLDAAHPNLRDRARMQAINAELRSIEEKLGSRLMKAKWPELESRRKVLRRTLGVPDDAATENPAAAATGSTNAPVKKTYEYKPGQGVKPK